MFSKQNLSGFTLVEMLVVISIVGILASMALPAISKAREAARATECSSNLKDFGVALINRSINAPDDAFCTGNFDLLRDGVPTEIGWVADLVNRGSIVSEMRCPSNPSTCSAVIEQMLTADIADFNRTPCADRLGRPAYTNEMGQLAANVSREIVAKSIGPRTAERAALIDKEMLQEGYSTNFAATWFLVRSGLNLDGNGNPSARSGCVDPSTKATGVTKGPLTSRIMGTSKAPLSTIPLLMDASPAGFLSGPIGELQGGAMYARTMVGGPIGNVRQIDTNADGAPDSPNPYYLKPPAFPSGHPRTGATGWLKTWSHDTRQDYRGVAALHGGRANMLMADGSVQRLTDLNNDGFINNGFDSQPSGSGRQYWTSSDLEAGPLELASYYSLFSKGDRE